MKGFIRKILKNKKAIGYVDSGVKILIAVVIGAGLLSGTYILFKDNILPTTQTKVESLFDFAGGAAEVEDVEDVEETEEVQPSLITFRYASTNYQAEEGMSWGEWVNSEYNPTSITVISRNYIGRDDGNGAGVNVYYKQNGSKVYVKADDLVDPHKAYQAEINMPIIRI